MKNLVRISILAFLCLLAILLLYILPQSGISSETETSHIQQKKQKEEEKEDWRKANEFEFAMTKDVSLGYVPKERLIVAKDMLEKGVFPRTGFNRGNTIAAFSWQERGPLSDLKGPNGNSRPPLASASGRVDAILVDKADPSGHTIWVGSHSGGVWMTNNIHSANPVWIPVYDMAGNLGIGSICQNPVNTNIMYFGTGDKTNFGDVRGGGIWKSTDHGITWNWLPSTAGFWNITKLECDAAGNLYAATNIGGAGIRRSFDGGLTWTNITPAGLSTRISDMDLSASGTLHVYCGFFESSTAVCGYRFTNSPATVTSVTWSSANTPFPFTSVSTQLAVSGTTLLAMPAVTGTFNIPVFYKSVDGGLNWSATASTPPSPYWSSLDAAINPSDPDQIIQGSLDCYKTTDGGATWVQAADGFSTAPGFWVHHDYHTILWNNNNDVIVGCDGGVFFSNNSGINFFDKNKGLRTFEFYTCTFHPSLTNYFLGGTQDNGTEQLSTAGLGSSVQVKGGDGGFVHIDQDEPQFQYCAFIYSQYRRSTDGGANWVNVNFSGSTGQFINPTDFDDVQNKMYCGGNAGEYIRWENPHTGSTFSTVTVPVFGAAKISSLILSPYSANRIVFGMDNGKIFTADNVQTNSPVVTDITGSGMNSSYITSVTYGMTNNNLIATFSNYGSRHVWVSSVGGGSTGWTNVSGNLPDIPVRWGMFYPGSNTIAIIATDLGVWQTNNLNGAATVWTQEAGLPAVRTNMLQFRASDRTLIAATYGRGIWTTTVPPLAPLPVTLISFSGRMDNNTVPLSWRTASEQNSDYFEVQRSLNGNDFVTIGNVRAAGNSNSVRQYNFTDPHPGEINYYLLKMVDNDDKSEYSRVIIIRINKEQKVTVVNPFNDKIAVSFSRPPAGNVKLQLLSSDGKTLLQKETKAGSQLITDVSGFGLSSGTYFLNVWADEKRYVFKLVKHR